MADIEEFRKYIEDVNKAELLIHKYMPLLHLASYKDSDSKEFILDMKTEEERRDLVYTLDTLRAALEVLSRAANESRVHAFGDSLNIRLLTEFRERPDEFDYSKKKEIVLSINETLRFERVTICKIEKIDKVLERRHKLLLAVASSDSHGRYVLQDRITKKRSYSKRSIFDLLPFALDPHDARKEGFIESRKKLLNEDTST
jgi:hypothetical protein